MLRVFYQLLIEILLCLPKTPEIKEQFLSFCTEKTNDNLVQQKIVLERMKNYTPDKAVAWYRDDSFLHKLLNRTCRLGNIKDMFELAFFMVDLNVQLKIIHEEYFDSHPEKIHVYWGRRMSMTFADKWPIFSPLLKIRQDNQLKRQFHQQSQRKFLQLITNLHTILHL